jgi:hypothetical protein
MARLLIVLAVGVVAFTVFTTVYSATADKTKVRALPKWAWVALCLFVPIVGGALYLWLGRPLREGGGGSRPQQKPSAPDDDPRFLRDMQKRMRDQNKKRRKKNDEDDKK